MNPLGLHGGNFLIMVFQVVSESQHSYSRAEEVTKIHLHSGNDLPEHLKASGQLLATGTQHPGSDPLGYWTAKKKLTWPSFTQSHIYLVHRVAYVCGHPQPMFSGPAGSAGSSQTLLTPLTCSASFLMSDASLPNDDSNSRSCPYVKFMAWQTPDESNVF